MALKYIQYYKPIKGKSDKDEFEKAVIKYAGKLNLDPDWLMTLMFSESGLNPAVVNSLGYVGLIQFGAPARKTLGVTKEELLTMGGAKQMEYVYKYFVPFTKRGLVKKFTDLYLITFYPNAGGKFGGTLKKPNDWKFPENVTKANPGIWTNKTINFDGSTNDISIKSFRAWADAKVSKEEKTKAAITKKEIQPAANVNSPSSPKPQEERSKSELGYITYIHNYSDLKTLDALIRYKKWNKPGSSTPPSAQELLDFEDNKTQLRSAYSKRQSRDISDSELGENLVVGARLKIPIDWVEPQFLTFDGSSNIFPNDDIETFISEAMLKATASPEYREQLSGGIGRGAVKKSVPKPRVWVWCKSLGIFNTGTGDAEIPKFSSNGAIFDLSPFITNLTTNVGGNAGTFQFSLPPLICECTSSGWRVVAGSTHEFAARDGAGERNFVSKGSVNYESQNNVLYRRKFLFHQMIQSNDIVYISLDNPEVEPIAGLTNVIQNYSIQNPIISEYDLPDRYWDMIGLVDRNIQSYGADSAAVGITVTGRDCMKLVIEESSYYLTLPEEQERAAQTEGQFINDNPENWGRPARVSKVRMASKLFSLQISSARTVGEMMSFIISSLAAIEIAPDNLFIGYHQQEALGGGFGISRYEFFDPVQNTNQTFKAAGIWQIIKLQVDNYAVNDRTVIENRLAVHSGSLVAAMKLFADGRFIEFFGDTYLDQYFIMVRRPPFNRKGVYDYLDKITGAAPNKIGWEASRIIQNADDEATAAAQLRDQVGVTLDGARDLIDQHDEFVDNGQNIDDCYVVSENLDWYSGEVYAWYRLNLPSGNSADRTYASDKFPVVFFREYCEIWGNRALDVQSNYVPWNKIPLKTNTKNITTTFETQVYEDLAYLVESNAYLPFTRQGTITIKGDRRIKAKTWIRYKPTGEVFYVEKVTNSYKVNEKSVDRLTTLNVSKGMVEYNAAGQRILPYYFKIIDGLPNAEILKKDETEDEQVDSRVLNVYFDFDKSVLIIPSRKDLEDEDLINDLPERQILAEKSDEALQNLMNELLDSPDLDADIIGHTDENGTAIYNESLSKRRSKAIKDELKRMYKLSGKTDTETIAFARRLFTYGRGESQPLESSTNLEGDEKRLVDARNRRIEVTLRKRSKDTNNQPPQGEKENDFSKWRVNPSIFNFFKSRRQFCESVEGLSSLEDYVEQAQPQGFDDPVTASPKAGDKLDQDGTTEYLHNNDALIQEVDEEFKDIEMKGRFDTLDGSEDTNNADIGFGLPTA